MIIVFMFGAKEELVDFSGPDLSWEATGVRQDLVNCDMIKCGMTFQHIENRRHPVLVTG